MSQLETPRATQQLAGLLERRQHRRHLVATLGELIWPELWVPLACKVIDMSDDGARLETLRSVTLPSSFTLRVPDEGFAISVRLKWRDERHIGVEFCGPPSLFLPV